MWQSTFSSTPRFSFRKRHLSDLVDHQGMWQVRYVRHVIGVFLVDLPRKSFDNDLGVDHAAVAAAKKA